MADFHKIFNFYKFFMVFGVTSSLFSKHLMRLRKTILNIISELITLSEVELVWQDSYHLFIVRQNVLRISRLTEQTFHERKLLFFFLSYARLFLLKKHHRSLSLKQFLFSLVKIVECIN